MPVMVDAVAAGGVAMCDIVMFGNSH
jgi:hypothetical protein